MIYVKCIFIRPIQRDISHMYLNSIKKLFKRYSNHLSNDLILYIHGNEKSYISIQTCL